ncbi:hypothetical protein EZ428_05175 [Pedobacter frigiditerrae]|uniref:Uncharacterized protein n=1 Tax=Pedobacter frigiditerrae TaxID=2530452 RepID=A0A4R0N6B4_9SPHI|nr:hypothetical protein [Pedobacter frigiditerrae]TCC94172.1 hypothetical protein EZ428_05175 [Pedobacter frigiditerrae]
MIKTLSKTSQIKDKLKMDGKVSYLDKPEHLHAIIAMNEEMESVRREYHIKDRNSQNSASHMILTA